jgi:hypothetical protein
LRSLIGHKKEEKIVEVPAWYNSHTLVICDNEADIAAVYCAAYPSPTHNDFFITDVAVEYFRPGLFDELRSRPYGDDGVIAPAHLAPLIRGRVGSPTAEFDPDLWLTTAAECIAKGVVQFGPKVIEKMRSSQAVAAALSLKAGDPIEGALRRALITAIWAHVTPYSALGLKIA